MIKYAILGLACSLVGMSSYAAQDARQYRHTGEIERIIDIEQYVDISLVIEGHKGDVRALLEANPEMANRLQELYTYCNSDEVLSKKSLFEAGNAYMGSYYLPKHIALSPKSYAIQEIREYDTLIKEIGLDRYMRALREPGKVKTFEEFKAAIERPRNDSRPKKTSTFDELIAKAKLGKK